MEAGHLSVTNWMKRTKISNLLSLLRMLRTSQFMSMVPFIWGTKLSHSNYCLILVKPKVQLDPGIINIVRNMPSSRLPPKNTPWDHFYLTLISTVNSVLMLLELELGLKLRERIYNTEGYRLKVAKYYSQMESKVIKQLHRSLEMGLFARIFILRINHSRDWLW